MGRQLNKYLRIFIMLVMAVSPLRGLMASSDMSSSSGNAQMSHMQHEMPASDGMESMRQADNSSHNCDHCCNSNCCEQDCGFSCTHSVPALVNTDHVKTTLCNNILTTHIFSNCLKRSVLPLLQPPISALA